MLASAAMFYGVIGSIGAIGVIGAALFYRRSQIELDASGASERRSVGMHGALVARR